MSQPPLLPHLQRLTHVYQPEHRIIAEGFERPEGANIGRNGEHLTIMFLSMNRSGLSERMCRSIVEHIPNFKGEILAIDNASTEEEFAAISRMLEELPLRTRIVRMDKNYGVAGGRNRDSSRLHSIRTRRSPALPVWITVSVHISSPRRLVRPSRPS